MEEKSEFLSWAEAELRRAGLFDEDSDYSGLLGAEVMRMCRTFDEAGHSGMSAMMAASIFSQLAQRKPLGPLTNDPNEWMHILSQPGDAATWQSRRQSSCFSNDGGQTYYDIYERLGLARRIGEWLMRRLHLYRPWMFYPRHKAVTA